MNTHLNFSMETLFQFSAVEATRDIREVALWIQPPVIVSVGNSIKIQLGAYFPHACTLPNPSSVQTFDFLQSFHSKKLYPGAPEWHSG